MEKINVLSLCDGISCGRIALERAGVEVAKYYACEIKPHALKVSAANYPDIVQLGDLTTVDIDFWKSLEGKIDLFLCGSPCQDLSQAHSERKGLKGDKSSLFYKCVEIMNLVKPKYFLFENVVMTGENLNIFTNTLGVMPLRINSSLVSAQLRDRLYWTNVGELEYDLTGFAHSKIKQPKDKGILLKDIISSGAVDRNKSRALLESDSRPLKNQECIAHRYFNTGFTTIVFENNELRYFNQEELEALQTLPRGYTEVLNRNQAAGVIGDAWTVDVIAHILKGLNED